LPDYITPAGAKEGDPSVNPSLYYVNPNFTSPMIIIIFTALQKPIKPVPIGIMRYLKTRLLPAITFQLSGSTDQASYLFSLNYFNQQGTLIDTYQKRYSLRSNTTLTSPNISALAKTWLILSQKCPGKVCADKPTIPTA
jgi:hypothetical protein